MPSPDYPRAFKCSRCTVEKRIGWLIANSAAEETVLQLEHDEKFHSGPQATQAPGEA